MKRRKLVRGAVIAVLLLGCLIAAALLLSPYGRNTVYTVPAVVESVDVDRPADSVFRFLGNSANASKWSVYVDTIVALNPGTVADGAPGALRRCFTKPDGSGIRWDEEITAVEPARRRQLTIFNAQGFPIMARGLATEQRYTQLSGDKTRLTFTLFFKDRTPTWAEGVKMRLGAYKVASVYRENLANIKAVVEGRELPHPRP